MSFLKIINNRHTNIKNTIIYSDDFLKNYYFGKTCILVGKCKNYYENLNLIKNNINNNSILICVSDSLKDFDICDFYINDNNIYMNGNNINYDFDINDLNLFNKIISFIKYIGCKNIITNGWIGDLIDLEILNILNQDLYENHNIHLFSLVDLKYINTINDNEFINIINYRELIVIHYEDINYPPSGVIRYLLKLFYKINVTYIFLKNGLKIIGNKYLKKYYLYENSFDITKIFQNNHSNNIFSEKCVFFYIHDNLIDYNLINTFKLKNTQKNIIWQDDLHNFAYPIEDRIINNICITTYSKKYTPAILANENVTALISPSTHYFKNLNITEYDNKIKFIFYTLNPDYYNNLNNDYDSRQNKIILSGAISLGYKTRTQLYNLKNNNIHFYDLIYYLPHPGYTNIDENMTEMNYYNKLSEFKGAFVGHYLFPINFPLAKHIEVLMCGCLGFFERNILLKDQLGLIEFEHYIPCSDNNGNLIDDHNFYINWLNDSRGKEIAQNGAKYVKEKFGENYLYEYIDFFKN